MGAREFKKRLGVFETSKSLASAICSLALDELPRSRRAAAALDPAVGDGVFLAELFRQWTRRGRRPKSIGLAGVDVRRDALRKTGYELRKLGASGVLCCGSFLSTRTFNRLRSVAPPGGFGIVIGNPPYGVKTDAAKKYGFNRDSYAAFIALSAELLCGGGVLAFLVPDTWQTIPSHRALREYLNENFSVRLILNVRSPHFRAAVNPCILIAVKGAKRNNVITAADFSRIDGDSPRFAETVAAALKSRGKYSGNETWAAYRYPQGAYSRFFIGMPPLAHFIESGDEFIEHNGRRIEIARIGDVAEVKHGLTTGANRKFIFKLPDAHGNYQIAAARLIMRPDEIGKLSREELENGFDAMCFGGRYLLPYDKGERTESAESLLPNYFAPTRYFIDWRRKSVEKMKRLPGHRHDNPKFYGMRGITFSFAGVYCPTFRFNTPGPFDHASSCIFPRTRRFSNELILGYLCSTPMRYLMRVFVNHTVNFGVDAVKEAFIILDKRRNPRIKRLARAIIAKQKTDPRYPFIRNEQPLIDELVSDALNLSKSERREIAIWFRRRYPNINVE